MHKLCGAAYAGILFGRPKDPSRQKSPCLSSGRPDVILNVNSSLYFFFLIFRFLYVGALTSRSSRAVMVYLRFLNRASWCTGTYVRTNKTHIFFVSTQTHPDSDQTAYTGCFTTCGHYCRSWFLRSLWSKKFSAVRNWPWTSIQDLFHPNSWQTPVAVVTVYSAPDDGRKGRAKHVEHTYSC